jgi:hypothetical protein
MRPRILHPGGRGWQESDISLPCPGPPRIAASPVSQYSGVRSGNRRASFCILQRAGTFVAPDLDAGFSMSDGGHRMRSPLGKVAAWR